MQVLFEIFLSFFSYNRYILYLNGWKINRLGNTDKAILRMGIYELMYTKTPEIVAINEAVELAKTMSDSDLAHVSRLIKNMDTIYFDCGHGIHIEKPKAFAAAFIP